MTVSPTSVEAYYRESVLAYRSCMRVRAFIRANSDTTNEAIAAGLRLRIQTVTPRVKELKENGIVWITGRAKTTAGRWAYTYRVATCPHCLSDDVMAKRRDAVMFDYYCWNCGRRFSARLGERSADIAEVYA